MDLVASTSVDSTLQAIQETMETLHSQKQSAHSAVDGTAQMVPC